LDDVLFLIDCLTRFEICVDYENSPAATGLQWMPANLTAGKRQPYLYSLFKSINARTVLPCQDTPSVKHTYSARVSNRCLSNVLTISKF